MRGKQKIVSRIWRISVQELVFLFRNFHEEKPDCKLMRWDRFSAPNDGEIYFGVVTFFLLSEFG